MWCVDGDVLHDGQAVVAAIELATSLRFSDSISARSESKCSNADSRNVPFSRRLVVQGQTRAIPEEDLHTTTPAIKENEQVAA